MDKIHKEILKAKNSQTKQLKLISTKSIATLLLTSERKAKNPTIGNFLKIKKKKKKKEKKK